MKTNCNGDISKLLQRKMLDIIVFFAFLRKKETAKKPQKISSENPFLSKASQKENFFRIIPSPLLSFAQLYDIILYY